MFCVVMSSATMEPESPEGEWPPGPAKFYGLTSLPHLEALGVIAAIYNHLEYTLFLLIWIYSRLEGKVAKSLFANMTNPVRVKFLRDCSESRTKDNPLHEHLINFTECFDIVAGNRNTLMHSIIFATDDESVLRFFKASRRAPLVERALALDVDLLRQTARDLRDVDFYGNQIYNYCLRSWWKHDDHNQEVEAEVEKSPHALAKLALPNRLEMPII